MTAISDYPEPTAWANEDRPRCEWRDMSQGFDCDEYEMTALESLRAAALLLALLLAVGALMGALVCAPGWTGGECATVTGSTR